MPYELTQTCAKSQGLSLESGASSPRLISCCKDYALVTQSMYERQLVRLALGSQFVDTIAAKAFGRLTQRLNGRKARRRLTSGRISLSVAVIIADGCVGLQICRAKLQGSDSGS